MKIDDFLDIILEKGFERAVYDLYVESKAFKLSKITLKHFEDIFCALIEDDIDILEKYSDDILECDHDYQESLEIIQYEVFIRAKFNYKYSTFLKEFQEKGIDWANKLIVDNIHYYDYRLDEYIFENYRNLRKNDIFSL